MNWEKLESISHYNELKMQAEQNKSAFVVFKHSPRCYISKMAFDKFQQEYSLTSPFYVVNVITSREVSNHIAIDSGVTHQSPQMLVVKDGLAVFDSSHENILASSAEVYA